MSKLFDKRPLSWSQLESFAGPYGSPERWYKKYILGEKEPESVEMRFGKVLGERLANDPDFLPQVPRLDKFEQKFEIVFDGIPMIGYADSFCSKTKKKLLEYKTSHAGWDQKKVDKHGQLSAYAFYNFVTNKIPPEDLDIQLVWIPTQKIESGDFTSTISLVEPVIPQIFKTRRTTADIVRFGAFIKETVKKMEQYLSTVDLAKFKL